jgi:lipid-binding SYLF domain-containing protein
MRSLLVTICLVLAISAISAPAAAIDEKIADRLWNAAKVVDELINAPDSDISKELLKRAECVAVIPGLKKAAFGFGGELGRGAVTCRLDAGKGPFGPPAMISLTGGSFGLQIGGQETDVVMLFMQPDSLKYLLRDKVTLGADASAAAGVSLKGSVLRPDKDANSNLYGRTVDVKELVQQGNVAVPDPAKKFIEAVSRAGTR